MPDIRISLIPDRVSLIQGELESGLLVEASTSPEWALDLEIHLYRHLGSQSKLVENV